MPKKKEETEEIKDEIVQEESTTEAVDEKAAKADDAEIEKPKAKKKTAKDKKSDDETVESDEAASDNEDAAKEKESSSIIEAIADTVAGAVEIVGDAASAVIETVAEAVGLSGDDEPKKSDRGNRSERVGVVASDKMEKTVSVRVDRLVKHPMYRKYVRKKKKFLAHDEIGARIGDKVRIVETRPLSARKRWRVVEIIQKAER